MHVHVLVFKIFYVEKSPSKYYLLLTWQINLHYNGKMHETGIVTVPSCANNRQWSIYIGIPWIHQQNRLWRWICWNSLKWIWKNWCQWLKMYRQRWRRRNDDASVNKEAKPWNAILHSGAIMWAAGGNIKTALYRPMM